MKKFFLLIIIAAVVGLVISRSGERSEAPPADSQQSDSVAATHEGSSAARPAARPGATTRPAPQRPTARLEPPTHMAPEPTPAERQVAGAPIPKPDPPRTRPPLAASANAPRPAAAQSAAFRKALDLAKQGKRLEARKILSDVYWRGDAQTRRAAQLVLERINAELVFNPQCMEGATVHVVQRGEVLEKIARKHKVNWRMIARLNGISRPNLVRINQRLKVLTGEQKILVDLSEFTLALFIDGHFIKQYAVGIGKDNRTPKGEFTVGQLMVKPDWYPPEGGIIKYGEKGHLIGERWIGFRNQPGAVGIGIHGTNEPETIGTACSNGCIRLHNKDVVEFFDFVVAGARVTIAE